MTSAISTPATPRGALCAIALLFVLTGAACKPGSAGSSHGPDVPLPPLQVGQDARLDAAAAALRSCTDLTLHDGLPHRLFERAAFDDERSAKSTEDRHGQFFYVAPIPIGASDVEAIRAALYESAGFAPRDPTSHELCGGFHADYVVTWSEGSTSYEIHRCFGGHEANLYDEAPDPVTSDLTGRPGTVELVLQDFRAQRPRRW
jgi:hypothetical protein